MTIVAIISLLYLCVVALILFVTLVLPLLVWLGSAVPVLVAGCFELMSSAIIQGFVDATIERKVKDGMTPEQAREAVERERRERAHTSPSPKAMVLFWVVVFAALLVVGYVDARQHPLEPQTATVSTHQGPHLFETREGGLYDRERGYALPHVGTRVSEIDDTYYMGEHTTIEECDSCYDFAYVWEAKNGTHDPVLKAYAKDGVIVHVEYCYEPIYWTDESGLPDLYAEPLWRRSEENPSTEP